VKTDLRDNYPFNMFAYRAKNWSASTPLPAPPASRSWSLYQGRYRDLVDRDGALAARRGGRSGMIIHNAYGYGLFTGGLGCITAPNISAAPWCRSPAA